MTLTLRTRPPSGAPEGALVLFHGRGADEHDLYPLLDILDPDRRLVAATPRGPLSLPPGGAHWYQLGGLGSPDPGTFFPTLERAGTWLDMWLAENEIAVERTVLGGFSQGAVMTYALSFAPGRPRPAGVLAWSGFMPRAEGFDLDLENVGGYPVAIGHGTYDPVIGVEWGREARDRLTAAGADLTYREYPLPHAIDPRFVDEVRRWLARVLRLGGGDGS